MVKGDKSRCAKHLLVVVLGGSDGGGNGDGLGLQSGDTGTLGELLVGSLREVSTTPVTADLLSLVKVVGLGSRDEVGELTLVLGSDLLDEGNSGSLLVDEGTDGSLRLDNDVGDTRLAAEGGEEDNELDGVNVSGDDNERSLLGLDQGNTVVETVLDEEGLLAVSLGIGLLAVGDVLGGSIETGLLLLLGLRAVLVEELEEVGGSVLVKGVGKLGDRGGNLQALVKDNLLALETNVLGPLDEAGKVTRRLDVLANTEVAGALLEERVLGGLGSLALGVGGGGGLLSRSGLGGLGLWKRKRKQSKHNKRGKREQKKRGSLRRVSILCHV